MKAKWIKFKRNREEGAWGAENTWNSFDEFFHKKEQRNEVIPGRGSGIWRRATWARGQNKTEDVCVMMGQFGRKEDLIGEKNCRSNGPALARAD